MGSRKVEAEIKQGLGLAIWRVEAVSGAVLVQQLEANPDTKPPHPSARSTVSLPFGHERQAHLFTVPTSIQVSPSCEQATRATASPLQAATARPVRLHFKHKLFSLPHSPCLKDKISGEFRSKTSVIFSFSQLHMSVSYSLPSLSFSQNHRPDRVCSSKKPFR